MCYDEKREVCVLAVAESWWWDARLHMDLERREVVVQRPPGVQHLCPLARR